MKYITLLILLLLGNSHFLSAQTTFKDTITVFKLVKHTIEKTTGNEFDIYNRTYFERDIDYKNLTGIIDTVGIRILSTAEWTVFRNNIDTSNKVLMLKKGAKPFFKRKGKGNNIIFAPPFFSISGDLGMLTVRVNLKDKGYCQVYYLRREGKKWKIIHSFVFCHVS